MDAPWKLNVATKTLTLLMNQYNRGSGNNEAYPLNILKLHLAEIATMIQEEVTTNKQRKKTKEELNKIKETKE